MACEGNDGPTPIYIDPVTPSLHLAKGLHWDSRSSTLYFVNMFRGTVHSYHPETDKFISATVGCGVDPMAIIAPLERERNSFIVSLKNDLALISWDGISAKTGDPHTLQELEPHENTNRINNGKVDPKGRLWAGTTGQRISDTELKFEDGVAALYVLQDKCTVTKALECVSVANGMEWSLDNKKFYFADSAKFNLDVFDYCEAEGKICNPTTMFQLKENKICGVFDAMTIDTDGKLYIANYLGCQVVVIDPATGFVVNKIKIPAKEVTSVCWGGPNLDILFVSTGNTEPSPNYPCAGRLFKVTNLGAKGVPSRNVIL